VAEAVAGLIVGALKNPELWFLNAALLAQAISWLAPIETRQRGRMFRVAKWIVLTGGAVLTAWYGTPQPAVAVLLVIAYSDYRRTSIRRKLPVSNWPKQLYR
jgi:hypothetical protein